MAKVLPTVSIVIPAYNEALDIEKCLKSIDNQTIAPDEVLVVDNNSTDETVSIAKKYPYVKIIKEKKQGILYARNAGFNEATSEIIGRIDADSRLKPGWVEALKSYYSSESHKFRAVSGFGYLYNLPQPELSGRIQYGFAFRYNKFILGTYILWGSNMGISKALWDIIKSETCDKADIHEDIDLAIHLHDLGYKIDYRKSMVAGVRAKRVFSDRQHLWPNLMMWPRTIKHHRNTKWPFAYIGAVFLYVFSIPLLIVDFFRRSLGNSAADYDE